MPIAVKDIERFDDRHDSHDSCLAERAWSTVPSYAIEITRSSPGTG